jgi:hypothetical protein
MKLVLFILWNLFHISNTNQCSCALGYRNGASASDVNLCMGPSESGGRPCYPTPCNADWTACTTTTTEQCPEWVKDTTHTGKRPDCPFVKISSNGANYLWNKLDKCKEKCINEPTGKCNMVSRFGDTIKQSTENYHCRFYSCPDPDNFQWITQRQWGNYASSSNTYKLPIRHHILHENIINKTLYNNVTRYNNVTSYESVIKYINKTKWKNKTRYNDICNDYKVDVITNSDKNIDKKKATSQNKSTSETSEIKCNKIRITDIIFIIIIIIFISLMIIREVKRKKIEKCLYGSNTIEFQIQYLKCLGLIQILLWIEVKHTA